MDKMSFVSIDFETMTPELSSACAVGLVKVVDNVIVQKFYSLIKPIPDNRTERNTFVHGITDEMVENAPTWAQLYPQIASMFDSGVIACHSASTDVNVLKLINSHYGITLPVQEVKDTFAITGKSLVESCQDAGIDFGNHHDPLCDATACAELALKIYCNVRITFEVRPVPGYKKSFEKKRLSHDLITPLDADEVENKETPFFQKKVVLTGTLHSYPVRSDIAAILKNYGADINSSISGVTDIVVVGEGAGPSKMKKIDDLNAKGKNIRVIYEDEFLEILEKYGIK